MNRDIVYYFEKSLAERCVELMCGPHSVQNCVFSKLWRWNFEKTPKMWNFPLSTVNIKKRMSIIPFLIQTLPCFIKINVNVVLRILLLLRVEG